MQRTQDYMAEVDLLKCHRPRLGLIIKRADSTDISFSVGACCWLRSWNLWPTSHDGLKIEIKAMVATKTKPTHDTRSRLGVCCLTS